MYYASLYPNQGAWSAPAPVPGDQAPAYGSFTFAASNTDLTDGVAGYLLLHLGVEKSLLQINFSGNTSQQTANLTSPNAAKPQASLADKTTIIDLAETSFVTADDAPQVYNLGNYTCKLTPYTNLASLTLTVTISDEQTSPTLVAAIAKAASEGESFDFIQGLVLPDFELPNVDPDTLD